MNLLDGALEVYRDPAPETSRRARYATRRVLKRRAVVSALAAPRARIRVPHLLA